MQSKRRDLLENEAVIANGLYFSWLRKGPQKRSRIGKEHVARSPIALKIHGLIRNGAPTAQF
jgi:hypothetical protein